MIVDTIGCIVNRNRICSFIYSGSGKLSAHPGFVRHMEKYVENICEETSVFLSIVH